MSGHTGSGGPVRLQRAESAGRSERRGGPRTACFSHGLHHNTHSAASGFFQGCIPALVPPPVQVSQIFV